MFPAAAPATAAKLHSTAEVQKAAPLQSAAFFARRDSLSIQSTWAISLCEAIYSQDSIVTVS